MTKVCLVTGGSSGIGLCTASALRDAGCTVYEISRREHSEPGIIHISADVTDEKSVSGAVSEIVRREGKIDILVNNAGFGISGAVEFTALSDAKRQLDVNFFGMVNAARAVIPVMRERGGGRILNLSSVAAPIPIPFQAYYSVSKAAVNALTLALGNELRPFGISVCAVMPGDIRTGFTGSRRKESGGDDVYGGRISRSVAVMEKDEENGMNPEAAGRFICRTALRPSVKPLYTIGAQYKFFVFLTRILPWSLINRIIGAIYAK